MGTIYFYSFFIAVYLSLGRLLGFEIYRNDFINVLIDQKLVKYESKHSWNEPREYEQNISPKWFRNILRIISIIIWPISFFIYFWCIVFLICKITIVSFIKFFTD